MIFRNFFKNGPIRGNSIRRIDCAHSWSLKMLPWPWFREKMRKMIIFVSKTLVFSESRKHLQASGMRAFDSPHRITLIGSFYRKFRKIIWFWLRSMEYKSRSSSRILSCEIFVQNIMKLISPTNIIWLFIQVGIF